MGQHETAMLTKEGFGTSAYLGDIRSRGSSFGAGGTASGSYPVLKDFVQLSKDISQGSVRRGAWAGYLDIDHGDFDEWADMLHKNPEGINLGWVVKDHVIEAWRNGDAEMLRRFQKALWVKCQTGKGYFWKVDHVNRQQPAMYKEHNLSNKASNLCLAGDTVVKIRTTEYGYEEVTMADLIDTGKYDDIGVEVWSFSIDSNIGEWKLVTDKAMTNPSAKLMKITDDETGKFIKCTEEHKVYTKNRGYVMAKDLLTTDELVIG
jgi:ribonucleotide reductase alpha subunit